MTAKARRQVTIRGELNLEVDVDKAKEIADILDGLEGIESLEFTCSDCKRLMAYRPNGPLGPYEAALLSAFVWSQLVEQELREMAREHGVHTHPRATFGALIEHVKSHLECNLHRRLRELLEHRNELVHGSVHMRNMWSHQYCRPAADHMDEEVRHLARTAQQAAQLHDELSNR